MVRMVQIVYPDGRTFYIDPVDKHEHHPHAEITRWEDGSEYTSEDRAATRDEVERRTEQREQDDRNEQERIQAEAQLSQQEAIDRDRERVAKLGLLPEGDTKAAKQAKGAANGDGAPPEKAG